MCNPVFIIRISSNLVSVCFYGWLGVCHCDSETCKLDHRKVIISVSDGDDFFLFYTDTFQKASQGGCFVYSFGYDFQIKGFRAVHIDTCPDFLA